MFRIQYLLHFALALAAVFPWAPVTKAQVLVDAVADSSGAQQAGLLAGDQLLGWREPGDAEFQIPSNPAEWAILEHQLSGLTEVEIHLERAGTPLHFVLPTRPWGLRLSLAPSVTALALSGEGEVGCGIRLWLNALEHGSASMGEVGFEAAQRCDADMGSTPAYSIWWLEQSAVAHAKAGAWDDELRSLERATELFGSHATGPKEVRQHTFWQSLLFERLGQLYTDRGQHEKAVGLQQLAVEKTELAQATVYFQGQALAYLAEAQAEAGLAAAEQSGKRSLEALGEYGAESIVAALAQCARARLALKTGEVSAAAGFLSAARAIADRVPIPYWLEARLANREGILAYYRQDLDLTQEKFAAAHQLLEQNEPPSVRYGIGLNALGAVADRRGDLVAAQDYWQRSIAIGLEFSPDGRSSRAAMQNLATLFRARGNYSEAELLLKQVIELTQGRASEVRALAEAHAALGKTYRERRDYARASVELHRALDIGGPDALVLAHLGQLAQIQDDPGQALRYFDQAAELLRDEPPDQRIRAFIDMERSVTQRKLGDLDSARRSVNRALHWYRETTDLDQVPAALIRLFEIELDAGRFSAAEALAREALELYRRLVPGSPAEARASFYVGQALLGLGHHEEAEQTICAATELFNQQVLSVGPWEDDRTGYRTAHLLPHRVCAGLLAKRGQAGAAIEVMERTRGQALRAELAERFLDRSIAVPADLRSRLVRNRTLIERASDARRRLASGAGSADSIHAQQAEIDDQIRRLREERLSLFEQLRAASPELATLNNPPAPSVEKLADELAPGNLRLTYVVTDELTWLLVLDSRGRAEAFEIDIGSEPLERLVAQLLAAVSNPRRTRAYREPARRLGSLLLGPILDRLNQPSGLLVVPDGPLHELPFSALLVTPRNGSSEERHEVPLIDRVSVRIALLGPSPARRSASRVATPGVADSRLVVLADPLRLQLALNDPKPNAALPGARHEADEIAKLFSNSAVLVGAEASIASFVEQARGADLLHLAAHTEVDLEDPLSSAILLAESATPGKQEGKGSHQPEHGGRLEAWQIVEDVLLDSELVTLAACETARGPRLEGEGLLGLVRTFRLIGARKVIASLWKVEDQSTSRLMIDFYRRLRSGGSVTEALAGAQRHASRGQDSRGSQAKSATRGVGGLTNSAGFVEGSRRHPYYWAAFQVYE